MASMEQAVMVLKAVFYSVKSLLGPHKMLKCFFSEDSSKSCIFSESIKLLDHLQIKHPVFTLLHDLCYSHQRTHHCGCTSLIVMCALWTGEVASLLEQGIPLPAVLYWFNDSLAVCRDVIQSNSLGIDDMFQFYIKNMNSSFQNPPAILLTNKEVSSATRKLSNLKVVRNIAGMKSVSAQNRIGERLSHYSRHFSVGTSSLLNSNQNSNVKGGTIVSFTGLSQEVQGFPICSSWQSVNNYFHVKNFSATSQTESHSHDYVDFLHYLMSALCPTRNKIFHGLAVKCLIGQGILDCENFSHFQFQDEKVFIQTAVNTVEQKSLVFENSLLFKILPSVVQHIKRLPKPKASFGVLVFDSDLNPYYKHKGLTGSVDQCEIGSPLRSGVATCSGTAELCWLEAVLAHIKKVNARVILLRGKASKEVHLSFWSSGLILLDDVEPKLLQEAATAFGCDVLNYAYQADMESVGVCTDVCIVDSIQSVERQQFKRSPDNLTGQVTYRLLSLSPQDCPSKRCVTTVLLCGLTEDVVRDLKSSFTKCLSRLVKAFSNKNNLLPGGGKIEDLCIQCLRRTKSLNKRLEVPTFKGSGWFPSIFSLYQGKVVEAFISGLQEYIAILQENTRTCEPIAVDCQEMPASLDVTDLKLSSWEEAHQFLVTLFQTFARRHN